MTLIVGWQTNTLKRLMKSKIQGGRGMKATYYSNEDLLRSVVQLERDWRRLYPNGNIDNPLYEGLLYERFLCRKRGLTY